MTELPPISFVCRTFRFGPPLPQSRKRRRHVLRHRMMRLKRWMADFNEVTTESFTDEATGLPLLKTTHRNPVTWERSELIEVIAGCGTGLRLLTVQQSDTTIPQPGIPEQPEAPEGLAASAGGVASASGAGNQMDT